MTLHPLDGGSIPGPTHLSCGQPLSATMPLCCGSPWSSLNNPSRDRVRESDEVGLIPGAGQTRPASW